MVNAVFLLTHRTKEVTANYHNGLKQIPVLSAVCLLLTVLCPELSHSFLLMI